MNICIKDTGIGIPEQNMADLFKLYKTYDNEMGTNKQGLGLGLAITKSLIKLLGPND